MIPVILGWGLMQPYGYQRCRNGKCTLALGLLTAPPAWCVLSLPLLVRCIWIIERVIWRSYCDLRFICSDLEAGSVFNLIGKRTFTCTNRLVFSHLIYVFKSMTDMNWFSVYLQAMYNLFASMQCFEKVPLLRLSTQACLCTQKRQWAWYRNHTQS